MIVTITSYPLHQNFNVVSTRSLMGRVVAKKINSIFASIATTIHIVKKIMGIQIISGSKVITFLYIFVNNLYLVVLRENVLEKQSERGIKLRGPSPKV